MINEDYEDILPEIGSIVRRNEYKEVQTESIEGEKRNKTPENQYKDLEYRYRVIKYAYKTLEHQYKAI